VYVHSESNSMDGWQAGTFVGITKWMEGRQAGTLCKVNRWREGRQALDRQAGIL